MWVSFPRIPAANQPIHSRAKNNLTMVILRFQQIADFAEMETVNRKYDRQWEQTRAVKKRPEEQIPVVCPFLVDDTQVVD